MVRILRITPIFLLIVFDSCIDPIEIELDAEVNVLIVEGAITTRPGSHRIRLSQSSKFGKNIFNSAIQPVNRAIVSIRDSEGDIFPLSEESYTFIHPQDAFRNYTVLTGIYVTADNFAAEVGKTYTLHIRTEIGVEYTSLPEKIIPITAVLGLSAEFSKVAIGSNEFKTGINVYATFEDPLEEQNFYMWENSGLYYIRAFPSLRICWPPPPAVGAAFPCPADCCEYCWVSESSADASLHILSDNNINGNKTSIFTAFIEDDRVRFTDKYLVRIEQHSLSREAFQFFKLLQEQLSINGDIFDPAPATIRGNMINLTNPEENVIGYFRASAVSIDSMFLTREMLLEPRLVLPINQDCRDYRLGLSTSQEPSYW